MTLRRSSVRLLRRTATVAVLAGALSTVGAPAASASVAPPDVPAAAVSVDVQGATQDSETGWIGDVRADSADSTKTVAGIAVVVVAGFTTAVTVRPRRRPPAEG
jgi:hypothetical protein